MTAVAVVKGQACRQPTYLLSAAPFAKHGWVSPFPVQCILVMTMMMIIMMVV